MHANANSHGDSLLCHSFSAHLDTLIGRDQGMHCLCSAVRLFVSLFFDRKSCLSFRSVDAYAQMKVRDLEMEAATKIRTSNNPDTERNLTIDKIEITVTWSRQWAYDFNYSSLIGFERGFNGDMNDRGLRCTELISVDRSILNHRLVYPARPEYKRAREEEGQSNADGDANDRQTSEV